eukprot:scaffold7387_cov408-Prasinococcus_capsulatus_cf.AAC.18
MHVRCVFATLQPDDGADRQPRLAGREQLTAPLLGTYSPEDQTSHSSSDNDQEEGNAGIIVVADAQSEDEVRFPATVTTGNAYGTRLHRTCA